LLQKLFSRASSQLKIVLTDKKIWVLFAIVALGAYLRLINIEHTFNSGHDFDEGAYSLAARFIAQGYWPYQDFSFVHPPLYELLLASIYKIFGYSFFYGRYLAVALSIFSMILIYLVGRKMYSPKVGLVAATLFAVSPDMVYAGRRVVQEPLGIFLLLLAVYFAINFIQGRKWNQALLCGLFLGLTVATKYVFIPAVAAIILATAIIAARSELWRKVKDIGRPALWAVYLALATVAYSVLLLLRWALDLDIAVPFIDLLYLTPANLAVVFFIFILPLIIAIVVMAKDLPVKQWFLGIWQIFRERGLLLLLGGTLLGFLVVTAVFLIKMPQDFIYQTVILQQNRSMVEYPALIGFIRGVLLMPAFLRLSFIPVLLTIPVIFIILNKARFNKSDCFIAITLITSLLLCQFFQALPRYYVSTLIFLFLGIAQLVRPLSLEILKTRFVNITTFVKVRVFSVFAVLALFLSISLLLLSNYTPFDVAWAIFPSNEEYVYDKTVEYLESAEAKRVYAISPSFPAMSSEIESTVAFDTFSLLWLQEKRPDEIVDNLVAEGVDYIVIDKWARVWGDPFSYDIDALVSEIRHRSRLMTVISPRSSARAEIYLLGAGKGGVFNGGFEDWVMGEKGNVPLGWESRIFIGEGDKSNIGQASIDGTKCLAISLFEDGIRDEDLDYSFISVSQHDVPFPDGTITLTVFLESDTIKSGSSVLGPAIHLVDRDGHALIIGFSSEAKEDSSYIYDDGDRMLVIKKAISGDWFDCVIDPALYWEQAGWLIPQEFDIHLAASASYNTPGYHVLYIAGIE